MGEKDLLEILATAAVVDLAQALRKWYVESEETRTGQDMPLEKWPTIDTYFEEAAQLMRRRRAQIIPMLKD